MSKFLGGKGTLVSQICYVKAGGKSEVIVTDRYKGGEGGFKNIKSFVTQRLNVSFVCNQLIEQNSAYDKTLRYNTYARKNSDIIIVRNQCCTHLKVH